MLATPRASSMSEAWRPVGPLRVGSQSYGSVTGRITAIAIDPTDPTGNTVYIGTTGGGVWKSTNAAGAATGVVFSPLTDNLPVYSSGSGSSTIASLSIGALSAANGVLLAGTGDPNDALDSYYGAGLLRSADGGATWTLVQESNDGVYGSHSFFGLGFAGLAWSGVSPSVAVAAVSDAVEGALVNAPDTTYSVRGLYYSTDAGVTWQMAVIKDGSQTVQSPQTAGGNSGGNAATAVVWNPVRQRFYAAVRYHGYYESANGAVWTRLAAQPGTGLTATACPADPGTTGSASCPIFRGVLAVEPVSGDTFAFTVDANNLDQGIWQDQCSLTGSVCARQAVFGSRLDSAPLERGSGSMGILQGDYDLTLAAVSSGSDTLVFAGAVDLYRCSLAAGCSFRNTTNIENGCAAPAMVAPAQHAVAAMATNGKPLLYLGNDGGLWRSTDGVDERGSPCSADDAAHFQNLNDSLGSLAEVVHFSQHPKDGDTLLAGLGPNGTAATSTASSNIAWPQMAAGEGGFTAIDPNSPTNWYISTAPGIAISHCSKGAACAASDFTGLPTIGPEQVGGDYAQIDVPWLLDPALSSDVLIGTCRVWRGQVANGSAWDSTNALSANFAGPHNASCGMDNSYVRSLAAGGPLSSGLDAAKAGSKVLYAGLAGALDGGSDVGGHLFSTSAGDMAGPRTAWTDLALSPVVNNASQGGGFNPGQFDVSSIAVDPHDVSGRTVYATLMGFAGNGIDAAHIYRSADGGATWTNISSNLPNAPANSVAIDPNDANTVYIALDTGVYATSQVTTCSSTNCWSVYGASLPNAPVVQLAAGAELPAGTGSVGMLRAATYGRGIWEIPLLTAAPPVSAQVAMTPQSLTFPTQALGTASSAQGIQFTNSGTAPLVVRSLSVSGSFQETDNCAGAALAVGASCSAQVIFFATAPGTNAGVLTIYGNIAGGQATASLLGIGAAPAAVTLSPLSLDFGLLTMGQTTAAQGIAISNTGGLTATLQAPTVIGDFKITANTCGASLPAGVSCSVAIEFSPTAAGTRNGTFTIADSAGTQNTSLTGRGASVATDTLSPASLSFGTQVTGSVSAAQTVSLTNAGDTALTLISVQIASGDFTVVNGCGSSLNGHAGCVMSVAFAPNTGGPLTGTLIVSDQFGSQTVALSGTGLAPPGVQLSPSGLSFPATLVGESTAATTVVISNSGTGQVAIRSISVTGDFTVADNCAGKTLSFSGACAARITFSPTAAGPRAGVLTVVGTGLGQQATAALTGIGLVPGAIVLSPAALNFGAVTLGTTSPVQNITVSNTGGAAAQLQTPTVSGDFRITANTCGATLAPSTGCTVAIAFTPTASGSRNGSFSITDSVGTQAAALAGTGASLATDGLTPSSLNFPKLQDVGTASSVQSVTLTNTGDNTLTLIAVQISNANFTATNICGPSLAGHSSCAIDVASTPTINGVTSAVMTVSDQLRSQTISLSGIGVAPPGVQLSPATLNFPGTGIRQTSPTQTVQISNFGIGQLTVTSVAISGDFAESDACAGTTLSGTATCVVQVSFTPTAAGTRSGVLTVFGSASGSSAVLQKTVALVGTGDALAAIVLDPTSMSFGTVTLGSSSAPAQNITISNTGGVAATLQSPTITGDFAITANTCATTLAPSTGCTVAITFTPAVSGTRSGTLSVTDSAGTQRAALAGIGAASASDAVTPSALMFAPQQVGTTSASQAVTLTNSGDNPLTLIAVSVSGSSFTSKNGCGVALSGHSSCTIAVFVRPADVGPVSGVLTVSDQFRLQTVTLSGTGQAPSGVSLSPAAGLSFAATGVNVASAAQTVTLSNESNSPLELGKITVTGDFSLQQTSSGCGASVGAGSACTFQVIFVPSVVGMRSGSVSVADSASGSPQTLSLQGIGIDFALNANGATSISVASGASAAYPMLLSSDASVSGVVTMMCAGAPVNTRCVVAPSTVPLGGTTTLTATVQTGISAATTATAAKGVNGAWSEAWWAITLPFVFVFTGASRRRGLWRLPILLSLALITAVAAVAGCGTGRLIPGTTSPDPGPAPVPTPAGTYSITVSAMSAGLTRSVVVTLVVK